MAECPPDDPDKLLESWQNPGVPVSKDKDGLVIDVRGLPPPEPLLAILSLLAANDDNIPVIAELDRNPVHLFPELAERGWMAWPLPAAEGSFRLKLTREDD